MSTANSTTAHEPIPVELNEQVVRLRRYLHANPELGRHLPVTQAAVLDALEGTEGIELHTGKAQSSVTALLRGAAKIMIEEGLLEAAGPSRGNNKK